MGLVTGLNPIFIIKKIKGKKKMKYNITKKRTEYKTLTWYGYDYKCDRCGKDVKEGSIGFQCSKEPDFTETDLCPDCIRELLDTKIPYEEIHKKYYKPYKYEIKEIV